MAAIVNLFNNIPTAIRNDLIAAAVVVVMVVCYCYCFVVPAVVVVNKRTQ